MGEQCEKSFERTTETVKEDWEERDGKKRGFSEGNFLQRRFSILSDATLWDDFTFFCSLWGDNKWTNEGRAVSGLLQAASQT